MGVFRTAGGTEDVGFDSKYEVETEFCKVGDFVHREKFVGILRIFADFERCDDESDATESTETRASSPDIGKKSALSIAENDAFDMAVSSEKDADFSMQHIGNARHAVSKFSCYEEIWGAFVNAESLNSFKFAGTQALSIAKNRCCHELV